MGYTPLYAANIDGHQRVVEVLLAAGANPDIQDEVRTIPTVRCVNSLCVTSIIADLRCWSRSKLCCTCIASWAKLYILSGGHGGGERNSK